MQSTYNAYETGDSTDSNSDSSGSENENSPELIVTPYATFEGNLAAVFGTNSQFGQSLGTVFEDIEVIDGCLYVDPDKQKFKLFSWQESNDMSPPERLDRGEDPSADDASDFIRKTYAGNSKEYELVAARVPEVTDEDGSVVIPASSKERTVTFDGDDVSFGDWNDLGGDTIPFGDAIIWSNGSDEHGPSVTAKSLAETLTEYGENAVEDEDDLNNWLTDASGGNVVREDLANQRVRFFIIQKSSDQYTYNQPIIEHLNTGERVRPNNYSPEGDEGNEDSSSEANSGSAPESYAEPVADFLQSGEKLDLTEDRAGMILDDLISDADNALTEELVEEAGGRDHLIQQVV